MRRFPSVPLAVIGLVTLILGGFMFESSISQATTLRCRQSALLVESPNFTDGMFKNPFPPRDDMMEAMRKWFRGAPNRQPAGELPTVQLETTDFSARRNELGVTWLGHSTVLLEIGGKHVITDLTRPQLLIHPLC